MQFIKDMFKKAGEHIVITISSALGLQLLALYFSKWISNKVFTFLYWLLDTDTYANWLVTLLMLLTVCLSVWLLVVFYKHIKVKQPPKWCKYISDEIWKVKWTWVYGSSYDYKDIYELNPTCPQCRSDVRLKEGYESDDVLEVICQACNSVLYKTKGTKEGYKEAVKAEIRKNVRQKYHVD